MYDEMLACGVDENLTIGVQASGHITCPWLIPDMKAADSVTLSSLGGERLTLWKYQDYVYETNHSWLNHKLIVNLRAWNSLKPEHQRTIEELAKRLEAKTWVAARAKEAKKLAKFKRKGMTVEPLDPHVMAALRGISYRVWSEYVACLEGFQDVLEKFLVETGKTEEFDPTSSYPGLPSARAFRSLASQVPCFP